MKKFNSQIEQLSSGNQLENFCCNIPGSNFLKMFDMPNGEEKIVLYSPRATRSKPSILISEPINFMESPNGPNTTGPPRRNLLLQMNELKKLDIRNEIEFSDIEIKANDNYAHAKNNDNNTIEIHNESSDEKLNNHVKQNTRLYASAIDTSKQADESLGLLDVNTMESFSVYENLDSHILLESPKTSRSTDQKPIIPQVNLPSSHLQKIPSRIIQNTVNKTLRSVQEPIQNNMTTDSNNNNEQITPQKNNAFSPLQSAEITYNCLTPEISKLSPSSNGSLASNADLTIIEIEHQINQGNDVKECLESIENNLEIPDKTQFLDVVKEEENKENIDIEINLKNVTLRKSQINSHLSNELKIKNPLANRHTLIHPKDQSNSKIQTAINYKTKNSKSSTLPASTTKISPRITSPLNQVVNSHAQEAKKNSKKEVVSKIKISSIRLNEENKLNTTVKRPVTRNGRWTDIMNQIEASKAREKQLKKQSKPEIRSKVFENLNINTQGTSKRLTLSSTATKQNCKNYKETNKLIPSSTANKQNCKNYKETNKLIPSSTANKQNCKNYKETNKFKPSGQRVTSNEKEAKKIENKSIITESKIPKLTPKKMQSQVHNVLQISDPIRKHSSITNSKIPQLTPKITPVIRNYKTLITEK